MLFAQAPPPDANGGPDGPADEPGRAVARLAVLNGDASVKRGDSNEWVAAAINAPLMSGDQISVAAGGRAEIQLDAAHYIRMAGDTELRLADLENGRYQIQVAHGLVTWRVLRDTQVQAEINTPLVGVHPGPQSIVRVEVATDGTSHITVRRGEAEVATEKGSEKITANNTMDVRGSMNDPEFQIVAAAARDEFDNWSDQRDTYLLRAQSQRYVTQDVHGVEDLDAYGHWNYDPAYGWVWAPTVAANWAPYSNGQWVWEDYYGWTWVDYAPWGWAPFHYGYWYNRVGFGWSWYPGPRVGRVWWRPAMVGFFGWGGGVGVGFGFGNIGWVPLAPHEVFRPWYGRGGFGRFDAVHNVNVVATFRNAGVAHGVTAVSATDFQRGNFRNTVAVDRGTLSQASVVRGGVPTAPTNQNLRFSNRVAPVNSVSGAGAPTRFYGSTPGSAAANARRTPFTQQQAAVRSGMGGGQQNVAPQQNPNWQRFQGTPNGPASNMRQANPREVNPNVNAPRGYSPNAAPGPRQVQVAPSIVRQRPEAGQAPRSYEQPRQQQGPPAYAPQSQPRPAQQAPAPRGNFGGGPAPRNAPAGGQGQRNNGRR